MHHRLPAERNYPMGTSLYATFTFPVRFTYFALNIITSVQDFRGISKKWDGKIWPLLTRKTNIIIIILHAYMKIILISYETRWNFWKHKWLIIKSRKIIISKIVFSLQNTYLLSMLIGCLTITFSCETLVSFISLQLFTYNVSLPRRYQL